MSGQGVKLNELSVKELISELLDNPPDDLFREMVELEMRHRCGEPIDEAEVMALVQRCRDKKILYFPKFGRAAENLKGETL